MGQAAVDVPDPKDAAPAAAATNSADDLLAQLAGEEIDRLLAEDSPAEDSVASAPAASAPAASAPDSAKEIEAVLNAAENATPPAPAAHPEAKVESQPAPTKPADDSATAAEMSQLLNDKSIDQLHVRVPIYVRALELMNSPFAKLPDAVREAIGKVAILTLFNSVAVLLYVLIFRRK